MPTVGTEKEDASAFERNELEAREASDVPSVRADVPSLSSSKSGNELISKSSDDDLDCPHQFKSAFIQVVEELRMRRTIDVENDRRIQQLVDENQDLKKKLEEEKASIATLIEKHSRAERNLNLACEEKIKQTENQKAKARIQGENWEQELKSLKDKIRALHLIKYSLEKKVTEQERQLQLQSTSRGSYLSQMNDLDQKFSEVLRHADVISEQIEKVETNVTASKDLHLRLQYVNEHHYCELEACKSRLEDCRAELMEARMKVMETMIPECAEAVTSRTKANDQELKMQTELNKQLQDQLSSLRKEHQEVLRQLKDAHSLIEKHAESLTTATQNEEELCKETASLRGRIDSLKQALDSACKAEQSLREESTKEKDHSLVKYKDINTRLKSLQEDYKTQQNTHCEELEVKAKQLATAKNSIVQLEDEIAQLQVQLICTKREMNTVKEQLDKATTTAQCVLGQHSVQTNTISPRPVNPRSPLFVPCLGNSPDVFGDSPTAQVAIATNPEVIIQNQEMSPLSFSPKKTPPVLTNISSIISPTAEPNNTLSKTESPLGKKRSNIEPEIECVPKKICIEAYVNAAIQEDKQLLTVKDCEQASPLQIQTCSEIHLAAVIQATPTDADTPQSTHLTESTHSESRNHDSQTETSSQPSISCVQTDATATIETDSQTLVASDDQLDPNIMVPPETDGAPSIVPLPVIFSEDEDSADEDKLWNTQLNKQIDKVQMFLKLDKLRRPKKNY